MSATSKFSIMRENFFEIDITPGASGGSTFVRFGAGIKNIEPNPNEQVQTDTYMDSDGGSETTVLGNSYVLSCSGDRDTADAAQNYIVGLEFEFGDARKTTLKWRHTDGRAITVPITIANIKGSGAEAGQKEGFGCDLMFNGVPELAS